MFHSVCTADTDVHVGANDLAEEGVFVWSNGEPVTHGWSGGEPNDEAYWGGEDCVSLSPWQGLIDIPCSINFGTVAFICERNGRSIRKHAYVKYCNISRL